MDINEDPRGENTNGHHSRNHNSNVGIYQNFDDTVMLDDVAMEVVVETSEIMDKDKDSEIFKIPSIPPLRKRAFSESSIPSRKATRSDIPCSDLPAASTSCSKTKSMTFPQSSATKSTERPNKVEWLYKLLQNNSMFPPDEPSSSSGCSSVTDELVLPSRDGVDSIVIKTNIEPIRRFRRYIIDWLYNNIELLMQISDLKESTNESGSESIHDEVFENNEYSKLGISGEVNTSVAGNSKVENNQNDRKSSVEECLVSVTTSTKTPMLKELQDYLELLIYNSSSEIPDDIYDPDEFIFGGNNPTRVSFPESNPTKPINRDIKVTIAKHFQLYLSKRKENDELLQKMILDVLNEINNFTNDLNDCLALSANMNKIIYFSVTSHESLVENLRRLGQIAKCCYRLLVMALGRYINLRFMSEKFMNLRVKSDKDLSEFVQKHLNGFREIFMISNLIVDVANK